MPQYPMLSQLSAFGNALRQQNNRYCVACRSGSMVLRASANNGIPFLDHPRASAQSRGQTSARNPRRIRTQSMANPAPHTIR